MRRRSLELMLLGRGMVLVTVRCSLAGEEMVRLWLEGAQATVRLSLVGAQAMATVRLSLWAQATVRPLLMLWLLLRLLLVVRLLLVMVRLLLAMVRLLLAMGPLLLRLLLRLLLVVPLL